MSDRHDSSTQMIDLNQRILDQTNQIKAITRVAEATNDTSGNILKELDHQRGQIQRNIDTVYAGLSLEQRNQQGTTVYEQSHQLNVYQSHLY
jgi:hypothetical protein